MILGSSLIAHQMRILSIFDEAALVGTITLINDRFFIFASSQREWQDIKRWIDCGFHRFDKKKRRQVPVTPKDSDFLERVAERAHGYNFTTELVDEQ